MSRNRRKGKGEAEGVGESAPMWIVSFCDLALVMLAFFVILSAMNQKTDAPVVSLEFMEAVASIKDAFGYIPSGDSDDPLDLFMLEQKLKGVQKIRIGKGGNTGNKGDALQNIPGMSGRSTNVTNIRPGSQTTIGGKIMFEIDSAEISDQADISLRQLIGEISGKMNVFDIKGHTSLDEERSLGLDRDLAYERAKAVVVRLVELGIDRRVLRVKSCRALEPIQRGTYTETARSVNRRVEIVATEALVHQYEGERVDISQRKDED